MYRDANYTIVIMSSPNVLTNSILCRNSEYFPEFKKTTSPTILIFQKTYVIRIPQNPNSGYMKHWKAGIMNNNNANDTKNI
jgi:hypothetical protein